MFVKSVDGYVNLDAIERVIERGGKVWARVSKPEEEDIELSASYGTDFTSITMPIIKAEPGYELLIPRLNSGNDVVADRYPIFAWRVGYDTDEHTPLAIGVSQHLTSHHTYGVKLPDGRIADPSWGMADDEAEWFGQIHSNLLKQARDGA